MPLESWICDHCKKPIFNDGSGIAVHRNDPARKAYDFKLLHKNIPGSWHGHCDPGSEQFLYSMEVQQLLGQDGLAYLLSFLSAGFGRNASGVRDMDEFVDFIRRFQTPYYEEARANFSQPSVKHHFGTDFFYPERLKAIANWSE